MPGFTYTVQQTSPGVFTNCCCGCARTPLVINPWVLDIESRPVHSQNGRMAFGINKQYGENYATAVTTRVAAAAADPTNYPWTPQYVDTYIGYGTNTNIRINKFPGGATLIDNPERAVYRLATDMPDVFVPGEDTVYVYCDAAVSASLIPDDGRIVFEPRSDLVAIDSCTIKLYSWASKPTSGPYSVDVNNCLAYPPVATHYPVAKGNQVLGLEAYRMPSVPARYQSATGTAKQLCEVTYKGPTVGTRTFYQQALGPVLLPADPNYNNTAFWEAAYDAAIANGTLQAGVITRGSNVTVTEWAEQNCEIMRTPLVINPWVGDATNNGRPIHAFGGRMQYVSDFGGVYTDYATAVAGNAAASPATGPTSGRYSTTYVAFRNYINSICNLFPGGATYSDNVRYNLCKFAYEYPDVISAAYSSGQVYCGSLQLVGAQVSDGKKYFLSDSDGIRSLNYVVKLVPSGAATTQYSVGANNCINYPPVDGLFSTVIGSYLLPLRAERLASIPGPTWSYATGTAKQLIVPTYGTDVLIQQALGPVLLPADPNYNNTAFWEAAYDAAIAAGTLTSGRMVRGTNATVTEWAEK